LFWRFCHSGCRAVIASALISHLFFLSDERAVSVEEINDMDSYINDE
jgi:hypothetical protein